MSPDLFDSTETKAPEAFRTIGEVAKMLGVRQHVLRYWEDQFPQLRPLTRAGNRRYYRAEDVAMVAEINRLLHAEGFTIRGARQYLDARRRKAARLPAEARVAAATPEPAAQALAESASDPAIARYLRVLRNRLASALEQDAAAA